MNKIVKNTLIILIVIAVIGWILYPKIFKSETKQPTPAARSMGNPLPVDVVIVKPQRIDDIIKVTGTIVANESVALRSEISGTIERIFFQEGQRIKKGDPLLTINDDEMLAQVERLRFTQKLNEDMEFRQRQLLEREAISREEYEIALTSLNTIMSEIKEREARLAKHRLQAPFDGIIGLREVSEGSYLSPSDLIANIYSINPIKIEFAVPGKYSSRVKKGDKIVFRVDGLTENFTGTIYALEPRIDQRTRTLLIRAISPNDRELLIPGQFANIDYILDVIPDAFMVPSESVVPELNSHKVFKVQGGVIRQTPVEIGLRTESLVQLTSGVSKGDTVITTGILQVREGMKVNVARIN